MTISTTKIIKMGLTRPAGFATALEEVGTRNGEVLEISEEAFDTVMAEYPSPLHKQSMANRPMDNTQPLPQTVGACQDCNPA